METSTPVIPAGYDVVWTVVMVAYIGLIIVALVSLSRTALRLSSWLALAWAALIIVVPILGALAWIAVGRRAAPSV
jgi:hypothetical protein